MESRKRKKKGREGGMRDPPPSTIIKGGAWRGRPTNWSNFCISKAKFSANKR
jgi:hypothetical protein